MSAHDAALSDEELATIEADAHSAQQIADRLHDLIQSAGGPHAGPALDFHTVEVLLRGISAEQTLRLVAALRVSREQVERLERHHREMHYPLAPATGTPDEVET